MKQATEQMQLGGEFATTKPHSTGESPVHVPNSVSRGTTFARSEPAT